MKHSIFLIIICFGSLLCQAQTGHEFDTLTNHEFDTLTNQAPSLEYVMELRVTCDKSYTIGTTQHGERIVIPITGGTFEGPAIRGTVLPGGADYQLYDKANNRNELEAIYDIRTDDGVNIHIRNIGLWMMNDGKEYFATSPKFEAPADSRYDWLNNAIFVCKPHGEKGVWKVE